MSPDFYCVLTTGFLLFFTFCLVLPVLPFCLRSRFSTSGSVVNFVLSYCAVTTLYVHPFSKCLLSAFTEQPLCLLTCSIFVIVFTKCVVTDLLDVFVILHVLRNFTFNVIAISNGAVIVSVLPSSHHNRKVNCCKLTGGATVDFKPVAKLFVRADFSCRAVFTYSLLSYLLKFVVTCLMGAPQGRPVGGRPVSLSHFFLIGNA